MKLWKFELRKAAPEPNDVDAFFASLSPWPERQEDYEKEYGAIDVKGKVVVDYGSDVGSTAYYFLNKGAKRVIMIDNNPYAYHVYLTKVLHSKFAKEFAEKTEFHKKFDFQKGDVLKSDCEGGEILLTKDYLNSFQSWVVAVHQKALPKKDFARLQKICLSSGGELKMITGGFEYIYMKAIA